MRQTSLSRLDRADDDMTRRVEPGHLDVTSLRRGALDQARDAAQHRRFTAFWDDLMN